MKIVFFGCGSIGKRHIKNLIGKNKYDLYVFRSGKSHQSVPRGVKEIFSWKEFDKIAPRVVFITNPTRFHVETAIRCADKGCHLFIEKPLGSDLTGLSHLTDIVKKRKLSTFVAYNLRFHPVIKKVKTYFDKYHFLHLRAVCTSFLPLWRPGEIYKNNYSASKVLGGGVILDLSHELDYVDYLLDGAKSIKGVFSKRSKLTIGNTEDFADIMINGKKGPANIHLNFFSQIRQRMIYIDFKELSIVGDLENFEIREYCQEKLQQTYKFTKDLGQTYRMELDYFLKNLENRKMMNNVIDASRLFKKIIEFKSQKI
jgi:predicted dehydrogenase